MNFLNLKRQAGFLFLVVAFSGCMNGSSNSSQAAPVNAASFASTMDSGATQRQPKEDSSGETVYICKSPGAKKFHFNRNCRGLNRCKHTIEQTTRKAAEGLGLGVCGYEH